MKRNNLYFALMFKFGSMEEAAKALGTTRKTLERRTTRGSDMPCSFVYKAVEALGIKNKSDLIEFALFSD